MIIHPKVRGFICTTTHPLGCERNVLEQIAATRARGVRTDGPKKVLVIGASSGYGLASRITAAFGFGADTLGVFFENPAPPARPARPAGTTRPRSTNMPRRPGCIASRSMATRFPMPRARR